VGFSCSCSCSCSYSKNPIDYEYEHHFIEHEHEFRASQLSVGIFDARRSAFFIRASVFYRCIKRVAPGTDRTGRLAPLRFYVNMLRDFKTPTWVAPMGFA
jgi:hypothetical protein